MVYHALIHVFVLSTCVYISEESNDPNECEIVHSAAEWTIDNLRNVTINKWPWHCLLQDNITHRALDDLVAELCPSIYLAARAGYIGFVQFYLQRENVRTDHLEKDLLPAAAESGNLVLLKYLIEDEGFLVDPYDVKLLQQAAFGGNVEMIEYLIYEQKLNASAASTSRVTALHSAAAGSHLAAVRFFVDTMRFNVDARTQDGFTSAHYAAMSSLPVLHYLIEKGTNLNAKTKEGETLLHFAALNDKVSSVKYLVEEKHMSVDLQTRRGETPLIYAIRGGSLTLVKYFVEERHVDFKKVGSGGRNVLHEAARNSLRIVKYFINDCKMLDRMNDMDDEGNTAALEAVRARAVGTVKFLVGEKNANTKIKDKHGFDVFREAVAGRCLPIIKFLVEEKGFEIDRSNYSFLTQIKCIDDVELCSWLDGYGRKKGYPEKVRIMSQ